MKRKAIFVAVVILALGGCGDDDTETADAAGDVDRYCELSAELDQAGSEAFNALEDDPNATEEDFARAMEEFNASHANEFQELRQVAPEEIRDDVDRLLDAVEAGAHAEEEGDPELAEVEERVRAFDEEHCV